MDQEWREWRETVNGQLAAGGERMKNIEHEITSLKDNTGALVDMFQSLTGAFKVLDLFGRIAKPLLSIAALVAAAYVFFKTGNWPKG